MGKLSGMCLGLVFLAVAGCGGESGRGAVVPDGRENGSVRTVSAVDAKPVAEPTAEWRGLRGAVLVGSTMAGPSPRATPTAKPAATLESGKDGDCRVALRIALAAHGIGGLAGGKSGGCDYELSEEKVCQIIPAVPGGAVDREVVFQFKRLPERQSAGCWVYRERNGQQSWGERLLPGPGIPGGANCAALAADWIRSEGGAADVEKANRLVHEVRVGIPDCAASLGELQVVGTDCEDTAGRDMELGVLVVGWVWQDQRGCWVYRQDDSGWLEIRDLGIPDRSLGPPTVRRWGRFASNGQGCDDLFRSLLLLGPDEERRVRELNAMVRFIQETVGEDTCALVVWNPLIIDVFYDSDGFELVFDPALAPYDGEERWIWKGRSWGS